MNPADPSSPISPFNPMSPFNPANQMVYTSGNQECDCTSIVVFLLLLFSITLGVYVWYKLKP
jgi:hypothetical protein